MAVFVEHQFCPICDAQSQVLLLGTIPSPKSRANGFYYGHPQNRFWKVLATVFEDDIPTSNEEKKAFLLRHHIALWDVLASCQIEGASDQSILEPQVNDINQILKMSPIKKIYATGKKAYQLYMKYCFPETGREIIYLPSTSPANIANYSFDDLVIAYSVLREDGKI